MRSWRSGGAGSRRELRRGRAADLRAGACAVGEKGATAGMVAEGVALALVIPTMRGLT